MERNEPGEAEGRADRRPSFFRRPAVQLLLAFSALEFALRAPLLTGSVSLYDRDLVLLYFSLVQTTLRGIAEGALPLRDPTSGFGQPILADPGCQILYPATWLYLFMPPSVAYSWFVSSHSVFGALGISLLVRRLSGGSMAAALFAGCAWITCGPLQSLANLWHHMCGAAWIPWVLLACERVLERQTRRECLFLGGALGMQMIAGSADMCAMTLLLAGLRIVVAGGLRHWRIWFGGGLISVALSAGVWLPALEIVRHSARSGLGEAVRTYWSLHPLSLIEFFLPVPFSALPLRPEWAQAFFEGREPFLASMFFGVSILPLVLAALSDERLPRPVRTWGFLGLVGAVFAAFGKYSPFYHWLVTVVPPLKILRYPVKAMVPAAVLMCIAAGLGVASIRRSNRSRMASLAGVAVMGVACLLLMGPMTSVLTEELLDRSQTERILELHRTLPGDLVASLAILACVAAYTLIRRDRLALLFLFFVAVGQVSREERLHAGMNAVVPTATLAFKPDYVEQIRPKDGGRIYVYDYWLFEGRAARYLGDTKDASTERLEKLMPTVQRLVNTRTYMTPLVGAYWNFEYAWDANLRLLFEQRLNAMTSLVRIVEGTPGFLRLLQIAGVTRMIAMHEEGLGDLTPVLTRESFPRPLHVYDVPGALPRAYLVSGRIRGSGQDGRDLLDSAFDPRRSVVVDEGPIRPASSSFDGVATVVERRSDRIVVRTNASEPGFLTLIEGAMPGWHAWIDDGAAKIERANALFIGTEVPAGAHTVVFRFLPASAVIGVAVTLLTTLGLLYGLLRR